MELSKVLTAPNNLIMNLSASSFLYRLWKNTQNIPHSLPEHKVLSMLFSTTDNQRPKGAKCPVIKDQGNEQMFTFENLKPGQCGKFYPKNSQPFNDYQNCCFHRSTYQFKSISNCFSSNNHTWMCWVALMVSCDWWDLLTLREEKKKKEKNLGTMLP